MWCERVIRTLENVPNADAGGRTIDFVDLTWEECGRVVKKQTRGGDTVRVVLPPGQQLRHNAVIFEDAARLIVVNVMPCEIIVAKVPSPRDMALLALELGNLHWPTQIAEGQLLFPEDGPALAVLQSMKIPFARETRRFEPQKILSLPRPNVTADVQVIRSR